jgi:ATP-binding cassette, subfamily B, bacterial PglK
LEALRVKDVFVLYRDFLSVLPADARRFVKTYSTLIGLLALFDAAALGLLALVVGPLSTGDTVVLPLIGGLGNRGVFVVIGGICLLTVSKGAASVGLLRWATRRASQYELQIGSRLFRAYIGAPWTERLKKNSADIVRFTDSSLHQTVAAFLLPGAAVFGEIMTLVAVVTVIGIAMPVIALVTVVYLGILGSILYFWFSRRSRAAGVVNLEYSIKTARRITEMVGAMKELTLRNKNYEVAGTIDESRKHAVKARATILFLGQVPRFVLESGIIGGFFLVGVAGYLMGGEAMALSAVALFALAGFRMAPSVVRFQFIVTLMTSTAPHVHTLIDEIRGSEGASAHLRERASRPLSEAPERLEFRNVSFRYPGAKDDAVSEVSLAIPFGQSIAIVGTSGAGKSTFIDLILGLIEPTKGVIAIDDTPLTELTDSWRAKVGYVPQEVALFDVTVAQNVAMSWGTDVDRGRVQEALKKAQLLTTIEARKKGINSRVGERGLTLSGGQRQRLGIARALYLDPYVLVMDEATSSLDTETEQAVTTAIKGLAGKITTIIVAHRLSTVRDADQILFMRDGKVAARGNFEKLVKSVPDFARQAELAGLT